MNLKKRFQVLFLFISVITALWLIGFTYFLFYTPQENCSNTKVDAIVVLTGGKNRIEEALKLFTLIHAKKILISGVGKGVIKSNFLALLDRYNISDDKVILGQIAQNTFGNAIEAKIFMDLHHYESMCLVTSNYHLPRSLNIFMQTMPEITVKYHPVFFTQYHQIFYQGRLYNIFIEYNKYLASHIIYLYEDINNRYDLLLHNLFSPIIS